MCVKEVCQHIELLSSMSNSMWSIFFMKVLELVMHTCVRNTRKLALNHWVTENLILNHDNECLK